MELRQLKYFVRIVEEGSVSRASQSLHVAQPALSQQINRLEEELGVKLLLRSVRGVTPTDAGDAIYRQALLILKQVDTAHMIAVQANQGPAGPVVIGLPWTMTALLGIALLQQVRTTLTSVKLEVVEGPSTMLAQMLAQGKLDLAVLFENTIDAGLLMRPMVAEPLQLVGAKGSLGAQTDCTLAQVAAYPLLMLSRPNGIREEIERAWAEQGIKPDVVAEINAPSLLTEAVRTGLGYTILPSCVTDRHGENSGLDVALIENGKLSRTVYLGTSRLFALSHAAEHVYQIVEQQLRHAVDSGRWNARWIDKKNDVAGAST